jgi:cold shock CspA family protein
MEAKTAKKNFLGSSPGEHVEFKEDVFVHYSELRTE